MNATKLAMRSHINDLRKRAEAGDEDAIKTITCFILIGRTRPNDNALYFGIVTILAVLLFAFIRWQPGG